MAELLNHGDYLRIVHLRLRCCSNGISDDVPIDFEDKSGHLRPVATSFSGPSLLNSDLSRTSTRPFVARLPEECLSGQKGGIASSLVLSIRKLAEMWCCMFLASPFVSRHFFNRYAVFGEVLICYIKPPCQMKRVQHTFCFTYSFVSTLSIICGGES